MAARRPGSSARGRRPAKKEGPMPDRKINFSDIPELSSQQLDQAKRVGRPRTGNAKQLIALRVSPRLLVKLKRMAKAKRIPYQTLMHELLEKAALKG